MIFGCPKQAPPTGDSWLFFCCEIDVFHVKHMISIEVEMFVRLLNPILMILIGLAGGIIVSTSKNVKWKLFGIGASTFFVSQVFHIPFNFWIINPILRRLENPSLQHTHYLFVEAVLFGLSAGVFEETARYIVFRLWIKDAQNWKDALMFGAGHGGVEAILLGFLTLYSVFQLVYLSGQNLALKFPVEQVSAIEAQLAAFWAFPWYMVLLGAIERIMAICLHVALSVLVLQSFVRRNSVWLFVAVGLHALVDAIAVYISQVWGPYLTEGVLMLFAALSLGIIFLFQTEDKHEEVLKPISQLTLEERELDVTSNQLEDSKYAS